jgi:hypothetical protein
MQWREELTRRFPALARLGEDAYVVGGAVRDLLLGRDPADADVACLDPLAAARSIRDKVIRLGDEEHLSAWRVVEGTHVYDFAELLDHDIDADLARRDFTMNAMAVHLARGQLLDPHGGQRDLEARLVRMVQPSNFDDDPLRALKGVRMASIDADDLSLAGAYALLIDEPHPYAKRWRWSADLLREVLALQALVEQHDRITLYDAGETIARQLPPVLRALGRDDRLDLPDFAIRALLTGEEIAQLTGLRPGKDLGRLKRALLEAQVRGEVRTRDEAIQYARA